MANANQQRFWMLHLADHWRESEPGAGGLEYRQQRRTLALASRSHRVWPDDEIEALARVERLPQAVDRFGHRARWDQASGTVVGTGAFAGGVPLYLPETGEEPTDLALGSDDVLYIALPEGLALRDLRSRWAPLQLAAEGLVPWRLGTDPGDGVWVLDRDNDRIGRVRGWQWPEGPTVEYDSDVFRPDPENPDGPRLEVLESATWPADDTPVAIACDSDGRPAVLLWRPEEDAMLRRFDRDGSPLDTWVLEGVAHPYDFVWLSDRSWAVLLPGVAEAPVFEIPAEGSLARAVGDRHPLRDHDGSPFLKGPASPPRYGTTGASSLALRRLSLPAFARSAIAVNGSAGAIDAGEAGFAWHRLQLEAVIPEHCGVRIWLAAGDTAEPPSASTAGAWYEHRFGRLPGEAGVPLAVWLRDGSELPFHPGMLGCRAERGRSGVFTVLVQRSGRRVRTLCGRYLWVRVELVGDGRSTPEIAALRAYGPRFSYRDRYLPELYRERVFGEEADAAGAATPADFLERFLDNFEGVLTTIEDRIANAHLLSHPDWVPEVSLDWLASWVGMAFDSGYPPARRRALLGASAELHRRRGTLPGLALALDLVTGGAVRAGRAVLVEDFRLRRTFATILGADLEDEADPLLGGVTESGNAFVGDTLFLGEVERREFLALFAAGVDVSRREAAAIRDLFDRLAHRLTVLLHASVSEEEAGLVGRVLDRELPAHVQGRVLRASHPLLVGVASLVGIDTYLGLESDPNSVRVGRTRIGEGDRVRNIASLDPRMDGSARPIGGGSPLADLRSRSVREGESLTLDGTASRAGGGHRLASFDWRLGDGSD